MPKCLSLNNGTAFHVEQYREVKVQIIPGATLSEKEIIEILKQLEGLKRKLQALLK